MTKVYPDVDDTGGYTPPSDIAELITQVDEFSDAGWLSSYEEGVADAVYKLMAVPAIGFVAECKSLLEDIIYGNRKDEAEDEEMEKKEEKQDPIVTKNVEVLPPIEKEKSLITKKEEPMKILHTNSINLYGAEIKDKFSPSKDELDEWYRKKPNFTSPDWYNKTYYAKKAIYMEEECELFGRKKTPIVDYTDEEMLEMLHTKEDDEIELEEALIEEQQKQATK